MQLRKTNAAPLSPFEDWLKPRRGEESHHVFCILKNYATILNVNNDVYNDVNHTVYNNKYKQRCKQ